jgi:starch-binding outer membrane protein, SusD/RagB family
MKIAYICIAAFLWIVSLPSCRKTFLAAKPDNALVVPATVEDLQALLDNDAYMNGSSAQSQGGPSPGLLIAGTDDYFLPDAVYNTLGLYSKNVYVWDKDDPYGGLSPIVDWAAPYRVVFYANLALEQLAQISRGGAATADWDNVKGSALFFRAHSFFQLAQVFAAPYDKATAASQQGIPLRLSADINEKISRASLQQTYQRIVADLEEAVPLLPVNPKYKTRPSKPAAYALLARTCLTMHNYQKAGLYADSCLRLYNTLLNYNTLNAASNNPFPGRNAEVIFHCLLQSNPNQFYTPSNARVDTVLYGSYTANDLRRSLFFRLRETGRYSFKGSYDGSSSLFTGIAADEVYLIRAECLARAGNSTEALDYLNTLLATRWKTGTFIPFTAAGAEEALEIILRERRKELLMRGLRWTDLRRLNTDNRFALTLSRVVNGQAISLPPGDNRYTWPIPPDVIGFNPSMPQNPR